MNKVSSFELKDGFSGLHVSGLSKSFKKRPIIRNVNLKLYQGEAIALLGPNGSGKTTCFYSIAGLINSDMGTVLLIGAISFTVLVIGHVMAGMRLTELELRLEDLQNRYEEESI